MTMTPEIRRIAEACGADEKTVEYLERVSREVQEKQEKQEKGAKK